VSQEVVIGKAMGNQVRLELLRELSRGPRTLEELSAKINLKAGSIYHHLRILQQIGLVEEYQPIRRGAPGRPYARYKLTGQLVTLQFPQRHYELFSDILLSNLAELLGEEKLKDRIRKVGYKIGADIANNLTLKAKGARWTLEVFKEIYVEDHLESLGLQPEVVYYDEKKIQFRQYNCPLLELAKKYKDLVCELDEGLIRGVVSNTVSGCEARRLKCIGHGDPYCEYVVTRKYE